MPRRAQPLSAHADGARRAPTATFAPPADAVLPAAPVATPAPNDDGRGFGRLAAGVRKLRIGGGSLNLSERTLMILGGIVAPIGLLLVFLGWYGASHTANLYEQIPYLISGGLLGLGLVFLGAFFYFTHWVTELVKEGRAQSAALVEAVARLEETVRKEAGSDRLALARAMSSNGHGDEAAHGTPDPSAWEPDRQLVATVKGTMAHRPDCVVVAGKANLRAVEASEGLVPCKLCDPYAAEAAGASLS